MKRHQTSKRPLTMLLHIVLMLPVCFARNIQPPARCQHTACTGPLPASTLHPQLPIAFPWIPEPSPSTGTFTTQIDADSDHDTADVQATRDAEHQSLKEETQQTGIQQSDGEAGAMRSYTENAEDPKTSKSGENARTLFNERSNHTTSEFVSGAPKAHSLLANKLKTDRLQNWQSTNEKIPVSLVDISAPQNNVQFKATTDNDVFVLVDGLSWGKFEVDESGVGPDMRSTSETSMPGDPDNKAKNITPKWENSIVKRTNNDKVDMQMRVKRHSDDESIPSNTENVQVGMQVTDGRNNNSTEPVENNDTGIEMLVLTDGNVTGTTITPPDGGDSLLLPTDGTQPGNRMPSSGDGNESANGMPLPDNGSEPGDGMPLPDRSEPGGGMPLLERIEFGGGMPLPDANVPGNGIPLPDGNVPSNGMPLPDANVPGNGIPLPDGNVPGNGMPLPDGNVPSNGMPLPDGNESGGGMPIPDDNKPGMPLPAPGRRPGQGPPMLPPQGASVSRHTARKVRLSLSALSIAVMLVGVVFNVPSVVVFWRSPATVSNIFIISILGFECTCLLLSLPLSVADMLYQAHQPMPLPLAYYRLGVEITFFAVARRVIVLVTAIMALDRFLTSSFPFLMRGKVLIKRPRLSVVLVIIGMVAFSTTDVAFRFQVVEVVDLESNSKEALILPTDEFRTNLDLMYFFTIANIVIQYVPTTVLVTSNLGLLLFLSGHKRRLKEKRVRSTAPDVNRSDPTRSVSVILAYSLVTMVLTLSLEIYMSSDVISQLDNWSQGLMFEPPDLGLIPVIHSFVNVLSWSVDFFIFFAVSSHFRAGAKKLMTVRESTAVTQQTRSSQPTSRTTFHT